MVPQRRSILRVSDFSSHLGRADAACAWPHAYFRAYDSLHCAIKMATAKRNGLKKRAKIAGGESNDVIREYPLSDFA